MGKPMITALESKTIGNHVFFFCFFNVFAVSYLIKVLSPAFARAHSSLLLQSELLHASYRSEPQ